MSYDLYCYKSRIGKPDGDEASSVIEADTDKWARKDKDPARKLAIVKALTSCNPRLEAFDFDFGEIAKIDAITIEQAKDKFDHIELNLPEGDLAIQIMVYDNHALLSVPYWYTGQKVEQLFNELKVYVRIIKETAGYFVYDPQTGEVFDPAERDLDGLKKYLSVSEHMDELINSSKVAQNKKPWWKIW